MNKKILLGLVVAALFTLGALVLVTVAFAQGGQDDAFQAGMQDSDPENEKVSTAYEYQFQTGVDNEENDPFLTRTRTQAHEMSENGECSDECEPQQLRLQEGNMTEATMLRERENLAEGDCSGDCDDPVQLRLQDGSGNHNMMQQQQNSACEGECLESGTSQQSMNRQFMGNQATGQGNMVGNGSCDREGILEGQQGK